RDDLRPGRVAGERGDGQGVDDARAGAGPVVAQGQGQLAVGDRDAVGARGVLAGGGRERADLGPFGRHRLGPGGPDGAGRDDDVVHPGGDVEREGHGRVAVDVVAQERVGGGIVLGAGAAGGPAEAGGGRVDVVGSDGRVARGHRRGGRAEVELPGPRRG